MSSAERSPSGPARSKRSTGYRNRNFYLSDDVFFRLRNAQYHTRNLPAGSDSVSELVNAALEAVVIDLEVAYNDGEPFPAIPSDVRLQVGPSGRARQIEALAQLREQREQLQQQDGSGLKE